MEILEVVVILVVFSVVVKGPRFTRPGKGVLVRKFYQCSQSLRRGAEVTANNLELSDTIIKFVHDRWDKYEKKRGKQPGFNMLEHYADGINTRPLQLAFTSSV